MPAEFRIDQVTPGTGIPGRTRHDLVDNEVITLVATSPTGPGVTYTWEILDKAGSAATLSSTTGSTVTIGPNTAITRPCSFRIKLTVNDNGNVSVMIRRASVRSLNFGLFVPLFPESAPSGGTISSNVPDSSEDNAVYNDRAGLGVSSQNWRGWAEWAYEITLAVESGGGSGGPPTGAAGGDLGGTYPNPGVYRIRGTMVDATAPTANQYLRYDAGTTSWRPTDFPAGLPPTGAAGGDLAGNYPNPTVAQVQGFPVQSGTPTLNDIWRFDGVAWSRIYHGNFIDGTAVNPSIMFGSDPDTGIYHVAADTIGVTSGGSDLLRLKRPLAASSGVQTSMFMLPDVGGISGTAGFNALLIDLSGAPTGSGAQMFAHFTDNGVERFNVLSSGHARTVDGTAAAPSWSFINDPNSGVYSIGADQVGVAAGGNLILTVNTTNVVSTMPYWAPGGSVGAPGYSFTTDSDTGIRSAGVNKMALVTGGADQLTFDSSTASFTVPVYAPIGSAALPAYAFNTDPNTGIYNIIADTIGIATGGVLRLGISTNGIDAGLPFRGVDGSAANPGYEFVSDQTSGMFLAAGVIGISTGGIERVRFTATNSTLTGNWLPEADNTRDLGSLALRWANLYVGTITAGAFSGTFGDGTVAAPSITFTADTNTGFWRPGSGIVGVTGDGLEVVRFQAPTGTNPQALFADGTGALPSISFANNTALGLMRGTSDGGSIGMGFIGAEALRFTRTMIASVASSWALGSITGNTNIAVGGFIQGNTTLESLRIQNLQPYGTHVNFAGSSTAQVGTRVYYQIAQTATAGFTALKFDLFGSGGVGAPAYGSGGGLFIDAQSNSVSQFQVTGTGDVRALNGYFFTTSTTMGFYNFGNTQTRFKIGSDYVGFSATGVTLYNNTGLQAGTAGAGTPVNGNVTTSATPGVSLGNLNNFSGSAAAQVGLYSAFSVVQTGGKFSAIRINITGAGGAGSPTFGSVAGSYLIDAQVGSASQFTVGPTGVVSAAGGTFGAPGYTFVADSTTGLFLVGGGVGVSASGGTVALLQPTTSYMNADWLPGSDLTFSLGSLSSRWLNVFASSITITSPALFADGNVSAPGIAYSADTNTGFWRSGTGAIGVAGDGLEIVTFQAPTGVNPQALFAQGALGTPSISFSGRTGQGFWSNGTTAVGLTTDQTQSYMQFIRITGHQYALGIQGSLSTSIGLYAPNSNAFVTLQSRVSTTTSPSVQIDQVASQAYASTTLAQVGVYVNYVIAQGGTAGFTQLRLNQTQTSLGSGSQYFFETQVGGATNFAIDSSVAGAGAVLHNAGSATRPSVSFLAEPGMGLYRSGSNSLAYGVSGTQYVQWTTNVMRMYTAGAAIISGTPGGGISLGGQQTTLTTPSVRLYNAGVAFTGTSGSQVGVRIEHSINQVASTAGFTSLEISRTETSLGSSPQYLINALAGAAGTTQVFYLTNAGNAYGSFFSFVSDPNSGMFSGGTSVLGFSTAGVSRFTISTTAVTSTLPYYAPVGTGAAPTYTFTSDTTSGMLSPGPNLLGLSAGGSTRVTISTTSVTSTLPILGPSATAAAPTYSFSADSASGMYSPGTSQVGLSTNGTVRVTLTTSLLTSTVVHRGPDGALQAPTYSFTNATNSGLYYFGSNITAMAANSVIAMAWSSSATLAALPIEFSDVAFGTVSAGTSRIGVDSSTGKPPFLEMAADTLSDPQFVAEAFHDRQYMMVLNNHTNTPDVIGLAMSTSGTISALGLSSTDFRNSTNRYAIVTGSGSTGLSAAQFGTQTVVWRGNAAGRGGFLFHIRWAPNPALVANSRAFVGLVSTTAILGNVDPSTNTNYIGVGFDSADTVVYMMSRAAGTTKKVSTGISCRTAAVVLDVWIYAPPNGGTVTWYVRRVDGTAGTATTTEATNIPATTTFLTPQMWCNNGSSTGATWIEVARMVLVSPQ